MRTISLVNQKGGCGKTTTAIHLAAELARRGERTLLVDLDPQGHCAAGLGVPEDAIEFGIDDALRQPAGAWFDHTRLLWEVGHGMHLAPATVRLAGLEASGGGLAERSDRAERLSHVLGALADDYDWCLVDCPPSIGLLSYNAIVAADLVLVPVETAYFALRGAERQARTIRSLAERAGKPIALRVLATMYDAETPVARDVKATILERFGDLVLPEVIGLHRELREAASFGQPISEFAPGCEAHLDFIRLADRVLTERAARDHDAPTPDVSITSGEWRSRVATRPRTRPIRLDRRPAATNAGELPQVSAPLPVPGARVALDSPGASASATSIAATAPGPSDVRAPRASGRVGDLLDRLRRHERTAADAAAADPTGRGEVAETRATPFGAQPTAGGVRFRVPRGSATRVSLTGDFCGWARPGVPMQDSADGRAFETVLPLAPGRYEYLLIVDGIARPDAHALERVGESEGVVRSVVEVGD